jgi:Protein of unknown function (DUF3761)
MRWGRLRLLVSAAAIAAAGVAGCGSTGGGTTIASKAGCPQGTYVNSAGETLCRPYRSAKPPSGATALCRDGYYSFSRSRSGSCANHNGVAEWLSATTTPPTVASSGCCDKLGNHYDPSGVNGPRPPNMLPSNETSQGYDRSWYCKHPPDPDGVDRSGSAYCSGMG